MFVFFNVNDLSSGPRTVVVKAAGIWRENGKNCTKQEAFVSWRTSFKKSKMRRQKLRMKRSLLLPGRASSFSGIVVHSSRALCFLTAVLLCCSSPLSGSLSHSAVQPTAGLWDIKTAGTFGSTLPQHVHTHTHAHTLQNGNWWHEVLRLFVCFPPPREPKTLGESFLFARKCDEMKSSRWRRVSGVPVPRSAFIFFSTNSPKASPTNPTDSF